MNTKRPPEMEPREFYSFQKYGAPTPQLWVAVGKTLLTVSVVFLAGLALAFAMLVGANMLDSLNH